MKMNAGIKKNLPYIIVFLVCVIIATTAFVLLNKQYKKPVKMKDIIVTKERIGMYEVINDNNIQIDKVPETTDITGYYTEKNQLIGKMTALPIEEDCPLHKEYVTSLEDIQELRFITLNAQYAQTGDAKPGDIVDIYRVNLDKKENWTLENEAKKVAKDVVVISLTNGRGEENISGGGIPLSSNNFSIETVKLGVKEEYINNIVPGSVNPQNGYVLVVTEPFGKAPKNNEMLKNYIKNDVESKEKEGDVTDDKVNTEVQEKQQSGDTETEIFQQ